MTPEPTDTIPAELERLVSAAVAAATTVRDADLRTRAAVLETVADHLDGARDRLVPLAGEETHLPEGRLRGELARTSFQLRLFAEVVREGRFLDARLDGDDPDWPMGAPRPDLRRMYRPVGPVAVFAASNFPFAFSVAGGDTASAWAAGNPVIVKAHPGHPRLSAATAEVITTALRAADAPAGLFGIVFGTQAGIDLLEHPAIAAGAFTGSIAGGRALFDRAVSRPVPIPFYGELGSNNPVFVLPEADVARGAEIAEQFIASFTQGAGQFCTKPGTLFVPRDSTVLATLHETELPTAHAMLDERIAEHFARASAQRAEHPEVTVISETPGAEGVPAVRLMTTSAAALAADAAVLEEECFGPAALVVLYDEVDELPALAGTFAGQLTATIVAEESSDVADLAEVLAERAGRVLFNEWPTGVSVTYAQQHGGPYPATTAVGSTSVGTAAIDRFLRPVAFQNFPESALPPALRKDNPWGVPQTVDGEYRPGAYVPKF